MSGDRTGMTFNVKAGVFMNELEAKLERLEKENERLRENIQNYVDTGFDEFLQAALEEKGDG